MNITAHHLKIWKFKAYYSLSLAAALILGLVGTQTAQALENVPTLSAQITRDKAISETTVEKDEAASPEVSKEFIQALLDKALVLNEQFVESPVDKFRGQIRVAELYIGMGENAAADAALQRAIATTQEIEPVTYRAILMIDVALVYGNQLSDESKMESVLRQALTLTEKVESHQISNVVETVASAYAKIGRYDEAIAITNQFPEISFIEHERKSVIREAAIHAATQGKHDLARELILEAEDIVQPGWEELSAVDYQDRVAAAKADTIDYLTAHYYQNEQAEQGRITADIERALIESVSDPSRRVDLYLTLATTLSWHDLDDEVLAVLPEAIAAAEQLKNEGAGDRDCYLRQTDDRFIKIGKIMIKANDTTGGLALLDRVDNVPCTLTNKVMALIEAARGSFDTDQAVQPVTAEIERLIPQIGVREQRTNHWLGLADIYLKAGDKARALQISDQLWQSYQSGELTRETAEEAEQEIEAGYSWGWDYILSKWAQFLNNAKDYEKAARIAIDAGEQFGLSFLAPKLVKIGADELAEETIAAIDDFDDKVKALQSVFIQYLRLSEPGKAHEAISAAIETIENGNLTELLEQDWYYRYDTGETLTQLEKEQIIRRRHLEFTFRLSVLSSGKDSAQRLAAAITNIELRQEMFDLVEQTERPAALDELGTAAGEKLTDETMAVIQSEMISSSPYGLWQELLYQDKDYAGAIAAALESTPARERGPALMTIAEEHFANPQPVAEQVYEQL